MPDAGTVEQVADLGAAALFLFALIGGFFGWWVYGPVHRAIVRDLREDRDFWRKQALSGTRIAERAVGIDPPDA